MKKKIGIIGHKTRGADVIRALENLGGKNILLWSGICENSIYLIDETGLICSQRKDGPIQAETVVYTIEEYENHLKSTQGVSEEMYESETPLTDSEVLTADEFEEEWGKTDISRFPVSEEYVQRIRENFKKEILLKEMERGAKQFRVPTGDIEEYESHKERQKRLYKGDKWSTEFECPDGYEFRDENGNVINATKIVLEKKKPKYPKTYEECCKILNLPVRDLDILDNMLDTTEIIYNKNLDRLLNSFRKLLICRDAYWKLAGDWKPDWAMYSGPKHCIIYSDNQLKWLCKSFVTEAKVLAFPDEDMRDFFYENFRDLIEECKELI